MNSREKFLAALDRKPITGRVPHFELVFFLQMEAFGHPSPHHLHFSQWGQMSRNEQKLYIDYIADLYIETARRYEHSCIFLQSISGADDEANLECLRTIREKSGNEYALVMHGDSTYAVPNGDQMMDFSTRMFEDPDGLKQEAEGRLRRAVEWAKKYRGALDGFALCSDYCFNTNPYFSPDQFAEFVQPYLKRLIEAYREMGFYVIKHTDGNIMPILDQMVDCHPHALHSLDPQGGVDIAEVKKQVGNQVCLIGNVNCGMLQTGSMEDIKKSVLYALKYGMPDYGYIFSTSNCVYTGMDLKGYEYMLDLWKQFGNYT